MQQGKSKLYKKTTDETTNSANVIQVVLKQMLLNTTNTQVSQNETVNLSSTAFNQSVKGLQVVTNAGGGDCLFLSIAIIISRIS